MDEKPQKAKKFFKDNLVRDLKQRTREKKSALFINYMANCHNTVFKKKESLQLYAPVKDSVLIFTTDHVI